MGLLALVAFLLTPLAMVFQPTNVNLAATVGVTCFIVGLCGFLVKTGTRVISNLFGLLLTAIYLMVVSRV